MEKVKNKDLSIRLAKEFGQSKLNYKINK